MGLFTGTSNSARPQILRSIIIPAYFPDVSLSWFYDPSVYPVT